MIVQYYNLIHLGFSGYREIMENCLANARILSQSLEATGWYTCLSEIHRPATNAAPPDIHGTIAETSASYVAGLPVVSFRLTDEFRREYPHVRQETVSLLLRARQWIVPNYALPPKEDDTEILRVVIRVSMSFDLLDRLVTDIVQVTESLMDPAEAVGLSVLHTKRKGPSRHQPQVKKGEEIEKDESEKSKKGEQKEVEGEAKKRMANGIHRSVC